MIISCPSCTARFNVSADAIGPDGRVVRCSKCGHTWQARAEDDETDSQEASAAPAQEPAATEPQPAAAAEVEEPPPPPPAPPVPPPLDEDEDEEEAKPDAAAALEAAAAGDLQALIQPGADGDAEPEPEPEPESEAGAAAEAEVEPPPPPPGDVAPPPPPDPPPLPSHTELSAKGRGRGARVATWAIFILFMLVLGAGAGGYLARERLVAMFPPFNLVLGAVGLGVPHLGEGLALASPNAQIDEAGLRISGFIENQRGEVLDIPLLRGALCDADRQEIYVWTFKADDSRVLPGERISYETVVADAPAGAKDISIGFTTEAEAAAESAANGTKKAGTCR